MSRRLSVLLAAILVATSSIVPLLGQAQSAQKALAFDVTSAKPNTSGDDNVAMIPSPNGITISNATLQMIVRLAYRVQDFEILGAPNWLASSRFDVAAKADHSVPQQDLAPMLRTLLGERFKLAAHNETRELPVYALVRAAAARSARNSERLQPVCVNHQLNRPRHKRLPERLDHRHAATRCFRGT
jgi:uncharacterized protein (TIGR03435 family)